MIILRGLCWGKLLILDNLHKSFCFKRFKKSQINKNKFLRMKLDIEQKKKKKLEMSKVVINMQFLFKQVLIRLSSDDK
jgi:hypothetical protein